MEHILNTPEWERIVVAGCEEDRIGRAALENVIGIFQRHIIVIPRILAPFRGMTEILAEEGCSHQTQTLIQGNKHNGKCKSSPKQTKRAFATNNRNGFFWSFEHFAVFR